MKNLLLPTALAAVASACVSAGTYRAKENELAQLQRESARREEAARGEQRRLTAELDRITRELYQIGRKLASVSYERDVFRDERDQDVVMLVQLKKRLDALGQNVDALTHEKGALAAGMADALRRLQEVDRQKQAADRRAATYQSLAAVAHVLASVADRRFTVVGHTDDVPIHTARFRSNWDLSAARAVEVTLFLVASGLKPQTLAAAGHGEFEPVLPNDSDEHRGKNRRVEIELEPNITELPPFPPASVAATP
jgi:chemotaxis protein MotB